MPIAKPKLITILGPTASGKSALAVNLAKNCQGEVISADSRQIYRGLDIGTGKITKKEMGGVAHHLLDIIAPGQNYSVAQFQKDGYVAIADIGRREKIPFLVGGTALYIYSVIDNYKFVDFEIDKKRRAKLDKMSLEQLQKKFNVIASEAKQSLTAGIASVAALPRNDINKYGYQNPRRLIRAIEKLEAGQPLQPKKGPSKYDNLILGIDIPRTELYQKIDQRVGERLKFGMIDEVINLRKKGVKDDWLLGLGLEYRFITEFLQSKWPSENAMTARLKYAIHAFARRQLTWWRRDKRIIWIKNKNQAKAEIKRFLPCPPKRRVD